MTPQLAKPHLSELLQQIGAEVSAVELELGRLMGSRVALVERVGRHTLEAGGKRLRPALAILSARVVGKSFDIKRAHTLGAALEMVHMATLIHDDVVDHADSRRGRPTASHVYGNTAGILTGDVLLAKAMAILAEDGDLEIIRTVALAVVDLAEGEVRELETRAMLALDVNAHLDILDRKTASFLRCCCEVGALIAGADQAQRAALADYGSKLGMAFQIADDLLDYQGSRATTGKPRATDFREGCPTLPLLLAFEHMSASERDLVASHFGGDPDETVVESICLLLSKRGGLANALKAACGYADEAVQALAQLPSGADRELLEAVAEFSVAREA